MHGEASARSLGDGARFEIGRRLGAGAFGVVYEAFDLVRRARVALKELQSLDGAAIYRFKAEFRGLADVTHPNLVTLHDLVCLDGKWFFTMELVQGVDFLSYVHGQNRAYDPDSATMAGVSGPIPLSDPARPSSGQVRVAPRASFDEAKLRAALVQLARGIAALHAADKLHCDLKPSNVMVAEGGRVVLLDFGLVTELRMRRREGGQHVSGTPAYMSPEQARGEALTPASDWYGMGVMLFEALTSTLPFDGSALSMMIAKLDRDAPSPAELVPELPEDLASLCHQLLRRDPAQRPSGAEVLQRLGASRSTSVAPPPVREEAFVGRDEQLAGLHRALDVVRSGRPAVVLLSGASGAGKTHLVRHFLDGLDPDAVVLEGRCLEREAVPFKALDSLVDALARHLGRLDHDHLSALLPADVSVLARIFPALGRVAAIAEAPPISVPDRQELRRCAAEALAEIFAALARHAPVVLCIDDLHWGDADSAALLGPLVARDDAPPVLLVATVRSDMGDRAPLLGTLRHALREASTHTEEIAIEGLTDDEARRLAARFLGTSPDDPRAALVAREAGGNPLFVRELSLRALSSRVAAGAALRLDDVLWERITPLSTSARALLEVISAAGRPIAVDLAYDVAEIPGEEWASLRALEGASLVRTSATATRPLLETYHDRIRQTVATRTEAPRMSRAHLGLAEALEPGARLDPEPVYQHYRAAGEHERARTYAVQAARRAANVLAFEHAAGLFRYALGAGETKDASRLRVELADALANAGHGRDAAEHYLDAAPPGGPEAIELRRRAADQLLLAGRTYEGVATARAVLARVKEPWPETAAGAIATVVVSRGRLLLRGLAFDPRAEKDVPAEALARLDACWTIARGLAMFDPLRAAAFQSRGLVLALEAGEPYRVARALAMAASFAVTEGPIARRWAMRMIADAARIADEVDSAHARAFTRLVEGSMACMQGEWSVARSRCRDAAAMLRDRCAGVPTEVSTAEMYVGTTSFYLGDFEAMSSTVASVLAESLSREDLNAATLSRTGHGNARWLVADDVARARAEVDAALVAWSDETFLLPHYFALLARAQADLYEGRGKAAYERIEAAWPRLRRALMLRIQPLRIEMAYLRGRAALARAAEDLGARRPMLEEAERIAAELEGEQVGWASGFAELLRGGVLRARRDLRAAHAAYERAAATFRAAEMAAFEEVALLRAAELDRGLRGATGRGPVAAVEARLVQRGVRAPRSFARLLAPLAAVGCCQPPVCAAPPRRRVPTRTRSPSAGASEIPRRSGATDAPGAIATSSSRTSSASTIFISYVANAAPRHRRAPPPNGSHSAGPGRKPSAKRSGRNASGLG